MPKIAIFDFDDTLVHEGFEPPIECDEALEVLQFFYKKKYIICIASLNEYAEELCKQTNLYPYIDTIFSLKTDDFKKSHLKAILEYYECKPKDCIFFDDIKENIIQARKLGIKSKLVNYKKGVTMNNALTIV
jgi:FMN phosphatase YigB (HAD superfamily)